MNRLIALALVCAAAASPLAAQQTQSVERSAAVSAAPAPAAQSAGPRVDNSLQRVQPKLDSRTNSFYRQETDINHSYLIYILVAAVLVVLLIFLIKRA